MADPLYELLAQRLSESKVIHGNSQSADVQLSTKYLSRLLSLSVSDLTTTEPQSLSQAHHSNHVSLQALSSRSHKSTIKSASNLSTLHSTLPSLTRNINEVREAIPSLDESAVSFASTYARSRDVENTTLHARKDSMLLARQSDKLTDLLELPALLTTAIASAGSGAAGSANYSQALDLFAHIKRLSIMYPDSALVVSVQKEAEVAMKSMTTNLLASLRSQNIRLASAIRTVGWLRRVVPELAHEQQQSAPQEKLSTSTSTFSTLQGTSTGAEAQSEGSFGALFLISRLHTYLTTTDALAPLRDLADQETERRLASAAVTTSSKAAATPTPPSTTTLSPPALGSRRPSTSQSTSSNFHGTQTERYLKRYIEIFREQSFSTISMYRNIFPTSVLESETDPLAVPSALQQFPLHLVEILMEVLRAYLPNVTDPAARESLLMQVLYAANSLGRLGADFSMMISLLDDEIQTRGVAESAMEKEGEGEETEKEGENGEADKGAESEKSAHAEQELEPEWARVIRKHRVQAARLDALAAGQNQAARRGSDIVVK